MIEKNRVTWSTVLDSLVRFAGHRFDLNEEYIAGLLSFFPAAHLTPYSGIHSVPPACFVRLTKIGESTVRYWDFDPARTLHYTTDAEYEEHFRVVFRESVRRRLRSDTPILAELSGGIDSSAIVCMADDILANGSAETPWLDTVSYYDDSEPNWDERPFFTQVEKQRGRIGCHINVGLRDRFEPGPDAKELASAPVAVAVQASAPWQQFAACVASQGYRVLLSGTGGDEVTGGVPSPWPELADLVARARFKTLAHQLNAWALNKRKPWIHLLFQAIRPFLPQVFADRSGHRTISWLTPRFEKEHRSALRGYQHRIRLFGALPSFQENLHTLEMLRRQFGCSLIAVHPACEKRYPFLDRDLLEFLFAVPREQILRPGQRRSLMRRALTELVPSDILNRKRKAFIERRPLAEISKHWASLAQTRREMRCVWLGIVDGSVFVRRYREPKRVIQCIPWGWSAHSASKSGSTNWSKEEFGLAISKSTQKFGLLDRSKISAEEIQRKEVKVWSTQSRKSCRAGRLYRSSRVKKPFPARLTQSRAPHNILSTM